MSKVTKQYKWKEHYASHLRHFLTTLYAYVMKNSFLFWYECFFKTGHIYSLSTNLYYYTRLWFKQQFLYNLIYSQFKNNWSFFNFILFKERPASSTDCFFLGFVMLKLKENSIPWRQNRKERRKAVNIYINKYFLTGG